jgi:hypothetical protein
MLNQFTQQDLIDQLTSRNIQNELADNGAILCEFPGLPHYGIGITQMDEWLSCYAFETYSGSDLGVAGHRTLDEAIAWALLLIVSCEARLSAEVAAMSEGV